MKGERSLKKLMTLVLMLALVVGVVPLGAFKVYAGTDFTVDLSSDSGVKARYQYTTDTLTISGSGTVEYDKWVAMARRFNSDYYGSHHSKWGWHKNVAEDFAIVFDGVADHAIKLCGTERFGNGLFCGFSGDITFNKKVDLAPTVTDLKYMFADAPQFNQPLNHWVTTNVTNIDHMFKGAVAFNQSLNSWDVSNVTDMGYLFYDAANFNGDISSWDVSKAVNMECMFYNASNFNSDISSWDVSDVTNMKNMFYKAMNFNCDISRWDVSNVRKMNTMFDGAESFNCDLRGWDVSNVENMSYMFGYASGYKKPIEFDISALNSNTSGFPDGLSHAFSDCATPSIILNAGSNTNIDATDAFRNTALYYLEFNGLKNATIDSFGGDYYVSENGGAPIAKNADEGYAFSDNQSYRVYLQEIEAPTISVNKSGTAIKVSWQPVFGAAGYQVYRADKASGPFTRFKTTTGLAYTNSGNLVPGMPYYYKVRAYRKIGSAYTFGNFSEVKGYYAPGALATPAKPSLTLNKNGSGIRLKWNSQKRITGYQVFRSLSPDKPFSYLKTTSGNATNYTNLGGLTQGRPYYYKIRAYRMAKGVRKYGAFSTIKGMFAGTNEHALGAVNFSLENNPGVSAPNVRVRWSKVAGAAGYCVYRWNSAAQNWTGLKKTGPNASVYTNINGVVNHKTNFYGMRTYHISDGTTYYGNIGQAKGFRVDK